MLARLQILPRLLLAFGLLLLMRSGPGASTSDGQTLSGANRQKLFASFSRKRRPSAVACVSLKAGRYQLIGKDLRSGGAGSNASMASTICVGIGRGARVVRSPTT